MRALVVFAHPVPESFGAALRDTTVDALRQAGHEVRLIDLYAMGFDPVMSAAERRDYHEAGLNERPVAEYLAALKWCEALVFVYPTWWFGLPAMLKGWLDRVFVPHATSTMPTATTGTGPAMLNIRRLVVVTSGGATWLISKWMREPGRNTIMRGLKALCHPRCRTQFMSHYNMDNSTDESRRRYLDRVRRTMARL